jgi:hypothetical protein
LVIQNKKGGVKNDFTAHGQQFLQLILQPHVVVDHRRGGRRRGGRRRRRLVHTARQRDELLLQLCDLGAVVPERIRLHLDALVILAHTSHEVSDHGRLQLCLRGPGRAILLQGAEERLDRARHLLLVKQRL